MAEARVTSWEILLGRALLILDSAVRAGAPADSWSLGGGTVLMLRYGHRLSRDIDVFVPDPQWLGYLTPRLNPVAESLTADYDEQAGFLKLYFLEGQVDFIACAHVTPEPVAPMRLLGRDRPVQSSAEILAKKIWHRAGAFTARDVYDLVAVARREPGVLATIRSVLRERAAAILGRLREREAQLREDHDALDLLGARIGFEECLREARVLLGSVLGQPGPRAEQPRAHYLLPRLVGPCASLRDRQRLEVTLGLEQQVVEYRVRGRGRLISRRDLGRVGMRAHQRSDNRHDDAQHR